MYSVYLLAAIAIAFVLQMAVGGLTKAFVLDPATVLYAPWTIITSMFLHGSFPHLAFNAFALFMFGPYLEQLIGSKKFIAAYFACGIAAALAYLAVVAAGIIPPLPALGASGAIYGILGILAVLRPNMQIMLMFFPMPMRFAAIVWIFLSLVDTLNAASGIAGAAHLGGLLLGIVFGKTLFKEHVSYSAY